MSDEQATPAADESTPEKQTMISVRLPESLHKALKSEAHRLNTLCIKKLQSPYT